jgi:hypothetical protein
MRLGTPQDACHFSNGQNLFRVAIAAALGVQFLKGLACSQNGIK